MRRVQMGVKETRRGGGKCRGKILRLLRSGLRDRVFEELGRGHLELNLAAAPAGQDRGEQHRLGTHGPEPGHGRR